MQEPRPRKVKAPRNEKPVINVGVVLEEDQKKSLSFSLPDNSYTVKNFSSQLQLKAELIYQLTNRNGQLTLLDSEGSSIFESEEPVTIYSEAEAELAQSCGIKLNDVVAGRGFHWRTELSETLPGSIEIHCSGDFLELLNKVDFEDYVTCSFSAEMSAESPIEFCKAHMVAVRSWAYVFLSNKHPGCRYDVCNDDDCQRYRGTNDLNATALEAAKACRGEYLMNKNGDVCPGYYSKSCGGHSEGTAEAFGFEVEGIEPPFDCPADKELSFDLRKQEDFDSWLACQGLEGSEIFCSPEILPEKELMKHLGAVDVDGKYYRWEYTLNCEQLIENLRQKYTIKDAEKFVELIPGKRGKSGRYLTVKIKYLDKSGSEQSFLLEDQYEIRKGLHPSFLFSSAFNFSYQKSASEEIEAINFIGSGWGHGTGLCQIGALGMGIKGYRHTEILKHYYPATELIKI